jgi:hypothetical protein
LGPQGQGLAWLGHQQSIISRREQHKTVTPKHNQVYTMKTIATSVLMGLGLANAWPGMSMSKFEEGQDWVGPPCTVGAHNWHPEVGDCPNMEQPEPPAPVDQRNVKLHRWTDEFSVDWKMYFVPDPDDEPPYVTAPKTTHTVTTGRTYYKHDPVTGLASMKEEYDTHCIPIFPDPTTGMGSRNDYSCDFLNVGHTDTAYVVLHDDKPEDAPSCCVIGRPFHPPPPNFADNMPLKWTEQVGDTQVDWHALYDAQAGIFQYGFDRNNSHPYGFKMRVMPWIATWAYQPFFNFRPVDDSPSGTWDIPAECATADICPGWDPNAPQPEPYASWNPKFSKLVSYFGF